MRQSILDLPQQFSFLPVIAHEASFPARVQGVAVCGMGGSALVPDFFSAWGPSLDVVVHRSYGLPYRADLAQRLVIVSSYSGNTEETLDAYDAARTAQLQIAVMTTGGALLARAQRDGIPYVQLPKTDIQPRMALGFMSVAFAALLRQTAARTALVALADQLDAAAFEKIGKRIAVELGERTPIVYASDRNAAIARYWKISINETGKNPAFANCIPELNHNEMTGFDVGAEAREMLERYAIIMLDDAEDDPRIVRRMEVLRGMLGERGIPVITESLSGGERFERIYRSILTACWSAYHLAVLDGAEPEGVPMVEDFKQRFAAS